MQTPKPIPNQINEQIHREQKVHGLHWQSVHDGYFSNASVAAPLVKIIRERTHYSKPDTIIDLGGGPGFLLSCLQADPEMTGTSLVNLDDSATQLDAAQSAVFSCVRGSVDSFARHDIVSEPGRCLFIMRSVLHYFGQTGLRPVLRHLRNQLRPGEYFIHQTASFQRQQDANCLNDLYAMMRTPKWYPTVDCLRNCLQEEGWLVEEVSQAIPLRLKHDDLLQRYDLSPDDIHRILMHFSHNPHIPDTVLQTTEDGFCAYLHYWIYVCTPNPCILIHPVAPFLS